MGKRTTHIRLATILATLLIGLAIHSTATGQEIASAKTSPTIQAVTDCESELKTANERLSKTLDAFEKATKAFAAAQDEIAAHVKQEELLNARDALRIQLDGIKDMIIKAQDDLIKQLQKGSVKSKFKKFLEAVEKIALFAAGVYIGHL